MEYVVIGSVAAFASLLTFFSGFGLGTILTPAFMLFFPIVQVGDDVAGHIDQKNTADPIFDKILL